MNPTRILETMPMRPHNLLRAVCLLITLTAAFWLFSINQQAQPLQFQTADGATTIQLNASTDRVLFPGQCVLVSWHFEGIREVYLNDHGKIGQGTDESCTIGQQPVFRVVLPDGRTNTYRLPVEQVYSTVSGFLALALFLLGSGLLVAFIIGPRALLILLVIVVFGPLLRVQMNLGQDYIDHNMFAREAMTDPTALPPHFLYHVSAIALVQSQWVPNLENAGFWVMLLAYIATALVTFQMLSWINHRRTDSPPVSGYVWVAAVLALMLIGPISALATAFKPGQFSAFLFANTYHNPTISLLRPLALLLFFTLLNMLEQPRRLVLLAAAAAGFTILGTLAKPNYTIAIAPAAALLVVYSLLRPLRIPRVGLIAGILIPSVLVLVWQFLFLYGPEQVSRIRSDSASIVFAPFDYFITVNKVSFGWLLLDLLASILFPALLYIGCWPQTRRGIPLNLSWLVFLIALAQAYLFNEKPNESHGNLTWGTQISLFILFALSLEHFVYQVNRLIRAHQPVNWKLVAAGAALAAHLLNHVGVLLTSGAR